MLFAFKLQDYLLPSSNGILTTKQKLTAVTAYTAINMYAVFI